MNGSLSAHEVAEQLESTNRRVVFAESCTAGRIAAELATVPGISRFLCGSFVTYRSATKAAWLGVDHAILEDPGPVSREVTQQMAWRALERTPEAHMALAITGHLGPKAPPELDGRIYLAFAERPRLTETIRLESCELKLSVTDRAARQQEAADFALRWLSQLIK